MVDATVAVSFFDKPPEAISAFVSLTIFQFYRRPHQIEARALQQSFGVERGIPFSKIENGKIEASIRGRINHRRDPFLILQFIFDQAVPRRAVGDNVSFADDSSGTHLERMKNSLLQKVAVKFASDSMNEYSKRQIAEIAVIPLGSRRIGERNSL